VTAALRSTSDATASATSQTTVLRADIQALRAIAVAAVMLYHLWPDRLRGGYVGVDVFFAISGFLITSHLLAEIDRTGQLRPARFWARRAKRLVPA
jgi:peptidoglycan/LPS O-acetylase OafA/YrhL